METHLKQRGMNPCDYNLWIGDTSVSFPLYGFNNKLVGFQKYTPNAPKKTKNPKECRYFTFSGNSKIQPVWGLEKVLVGDIVFLTEGVFKSVAVHNCGYNSWSVLGSDISKPLLQQLVLLPYTFICIGDNDKAGISFSQTFRKGLVSSDIDELSTEQLHKILTEVIENESKI